PHLKMPLQEHNSMYKHTDTKVRLKRAVILADGENTLLAPLVKHMSILNLPVFNKPIIEHTMKCLAHNGINSVVIVGRKGGGVDIPACTFGDKGPPLKIEYFEPDFPCGTAGALRDLQDFFEDEDFLVLQGNTYAEYNAVEDLIRFHLSRGSALTIGASRLNRDSLETLTTGKDGLVENISIIHASRDRRHPIKSEGIFVVNPRALSLVGGGGVF
ncbi:MAG: NDP-sugar synthase, partial [Thermodesulfobacteriota bacterium]